MSDISLHWSAAELALIALLACAPGIAAGLVLGAIAWRGHRLRGAALGALAGLALSLAIYVICFQSRIAQADGFGGAALLALQLSFPGLLLGGALAAWNWPRRRIVASMCGAPLGAVAWLGGWAVFF